jgi:trimeric autotransporter adhesin
MREAVGSGLLGPPGVAFLITQPQGMVAGHHVDPTQGYDASSICGGGNGSEGTAAVAQQRRGDEALLLYHREAQPASLEHHTHQHRAHRRHHDPVSDACPSSSLVQLQGGAVPHPSQVSSAAAVPTVVATPTSAPHGHLTTPAKSVAGPFPSPPCPLHSIIFAIVLAESHTRREIAHRWERRLLRYWANFKEERVALALQPLSTSAAAAPALPAQVVAGKLEKRTAQTHYIENAGRNVPDRLPPSAPALYALQERSEAVLQQLPAAATTWEVPSAEIKEDDATPTVVLPVPTVLPSHAASLALVTTESKADSSEQKAASATSMAQETTAHLQREVEAAHVTADQEAAEARRGAEDEEAAARLSVRTAESEAREFLRQNFGDSHAAATAAEAARVAVEREATRAKADQEAAEARRGAEDEEAAARLSVRTAESEAREFLRQNFGDSHAAATAAEAARVAVEREATRAKADQEAAEARRGAEDEEAAARLSVRTAESEAREFLRQNFGDSHAAATAAEAARVEAEAEAARVAEVARMKVERGRAAKAAREGLESEQRSALADLWAVQEDAFAHLLREEKAMRVAAAEAKDRRCARDREELRVRQERAGVAHSLHHLTNLLLDEWVRDAATLAAAKVAELERRAKEEEERLDVAAAQAEAVEAARREKECEQAEAALTQAGQRAAAEAAHVKAEQEAAEARRGAEDEEAAARLSVRTAESEAREFLRHDLGNSHAAATAAEAACVMAEQDAAAAAAAAAKSAHVQSEAAAAAERIAAQQAKELHIRALETLSATLVNACVSNTADAHAAAAAAQREQDRKEAEKEEARRETAHAEAEVAAAAAAREDAARQNEQAEGRAAAATAARKADECAALSSVADGLLSQWIEESVVAATEMKVQKEAAQQRAAAEEQAARQALEDDEALLRNGVVALEQQEVTKVHDAAVERTVRQQQEQEAEARANVARSAVDEVVELSSKDPAMAVRGSRGVSSAASTPCSSATSLPSSSLESSSSGPAQVRLPSPAAFVYFADCLLADVMHDAAEEASQRRGAAQDAHESSVVKPLEDSVLRQPESQEGQHRTTGALVSSSTPPSPSSLSSPSTSSFASPASTPGSVPPQAGPPPPLPPPAVVAAAAAVTHSSSSRAPRGGEEGGKEGALDGGAQAESSSEAAVASPAQLQLSASPLSSIAADGVTAASADSPNEHAPSPSSSSAREKQGPPRDGDADALQAFTTAGTLFSSPMRSFSVTSSAGDDEDELPTVAAQGVRQPLSLTPPPDRNLSPLLSTGDNSPANAAATTGRSGEPEEGGTSAEQRDVPGTLQKNTEGFPVSCESLVEEVAAAAAAARKDSGEEVEMSVSAFTEDWKALDLDAPRITTTAAPFDLEFTRGTSVWTVGALEAASAHVMETLIRDAVRLLPSHRHSPSLSPERLDRVAALSPSHLHLFPDAQEHVDRGAAKEVAGSNAGEDAARHPDKKHHSISELGPGFVKSDAQEALPLSPSSSPSTTQLVGVPAVVPGATGADVRADLASLTTLVTAVATPNDFVEQLRQQEAAKKQAAYRQNRYLTPRELSLVAAAYLTSEAAAAQVQDLGPVEALTARAISLVLSVGLVHRVTVANRRARRRIEAEAAAAAAKPGSGGHTDERGRGSGGAGGALSAAKSVDTRSNGAAATTPTSTLATVESSTDNPDGVFPRSSAAAAGKRGREAAGGFYDEGDESGVPPSSPSLGRHSFGGPLGGGGSGTSFPSSGDAGGFPAGAAANTNGSEGAEEKVEDTYSFAGASPSVMSPSAQSPSFAHVGSATSASPAASPAASGQDAATGTPSAPPPPPPVNSPTTAVTTTATTAATTTSKEDAPMGSTKVDEARPPLPSDWDAGLRGVAERIAHDFMDYATRRVLLGQGEGQSHQDHLRTTQAVLHDALATVNIRKLFTQELRARDVARLTTYYVDLALNGARERADPHYAPAALGEHNIFGRRSSGDTDEASSPGILGSTLFPSSALDAESQDMALMVGEAGSSPISSAASPSSVFSPSAFSPRLHPRHDTFLTAATAIHVRRAGLLQLVLEQCISNVMNDLVGDTVGWLGTVLVPPTASAAEATRP